jgi:hypothetical protein
MSSVLVNKFSFLWHNVQAKERGGFLGVISGSYLKKGGIIDTVFEILGERQ